MPADLGHNGPYAHRFGKIAPPCAKVPRPGDIIPMSFVDPCRGKERDGDGGIAVAQQEPTRARPAPHGERIKLMRKKDWKKMADPGLRALVALGIVRKRSSLPTIAGIAAALFTGGLLVGIVPRFRIAVTDFATRMLPPKATKLWAVSREPEANDIQRADDDGMSSAFHS